MKKIVFIAALTVFGLMKVNSQISYGLTAGYNNLIAKAKVENRGGGSGSNGVSGFYVGFFVDFEVAEKFSIQPEIQYANITEDGGSGNELMIPIMAKYYVAEKFNLQAGPMLDFILDETNEGVNTFGLGLAVGGAFDATENLFISTKYSFGLTNRTNNSVTIPNVGTFDVTTKFDIFQIGLGYRF